MTVEDERIESESERNVGVSGEESVGVRRSKREKEKV